MAEPKYVWELPVSPTLTNQLEILIAQHNINQAYRTTLIELKNYSNQAIYSIAGVEKTGGPTYTVALIDQLDGNYTAYFPYNDTLGNEIKTGTKITIIDGTIFYIRQLVDESDYVAVIVETLGTDPFNQHPYYYSDSPILVDSNDYVSVPAIISDNIQTKTHIIDGVDETGATPKNYIGREESVSPVTGDFLETSLSKYRCLESVGFKSWVRIRSAASWSLPDGSYVTPSQFPLAGFSSLSSIGNDIEIVDNSFRFKQSGVYKFSVKLVLKPTLSTNNFGMFMLDNDVREEDINKFVALIAALQNVSITIPFFVSTDFEVVITENKINSPYVFWYTSQGSFTVGFNPTIWGGHTLPYATSIEVIKLQ